MHFFPRVPHLLMGRLHIVEFLLLLRCQQWTNFSHGVLHDRMGFLHRVLMNGDNLGFGLIDNRLDLRLLIGCQIQRIGQMIEPESTSSVSVPSARATMTSICLNKGQTANHDGSGGGKCKEVSFHSFGLFDFFLSSEPFRARFIGDDRAKAPSVTKKL